MAKATEFKRPSIDSDDWIECGLALANLEDRYGSIGKEVLISAIWGQRIDIAAESTSFYHDYGGGHLVLYDQLKAELKKKGLYSDFKQAELHPSRPCMISKHAFKNQGFKESDVKDWDLEEGRLIITHENRPLPLRMLINGARLLRSQVNDASLLRPFVRDATRASIKSSATKTTVRRWDWEGALIELISIAHHPDGLDEFLTGTRQRQRNAIAAALSRILQKLAGTEDEPGRKELLERADRIVGLIEASKALRKAT